MTKKIVIIALNFILSFSLLISSCYAWFVITNKVTVDTAVVGDTLSSIVVESFDGSSYENEFADGNKFAFSSDTIKFYQYNNQIFASTESEYKYRITVICNCEDSDQPMKLYFNKNTAISSQTGLDTLSFLKVEYSLNEENWFDANEGLNEVDSLFYEDSTIEGKYIATLYFRIKPDIEAVHSAINSSSAIINLSVTNIISMNFGFKTTPYKES